jgi:hypothetical protein
MENVLITSARQEPVFLSPAPANVTLRGVTRTSAFMSYVILALGLLTAVIGSRMTLGAVSSVPIFDEWFEIHAIASAPNHWPPVSWIWSQHNEHRIVFYRLLLLADIHFFNGRHRIEFWGVLLTQWASFGLLIWLVLLGRLDGHLARATIGLGAFCLFCPTQWENTACGFGISFLLSIFFLLLALLGLFKYHSQAGEYQHRYVWLSVVAASVSTFANGNGVLTWPVLVAVGALLGMRARILLLYGLCGCIFLGLYLYHYTSPPIHADPFKSLQHPVLLLGYVVSYMGVILPPWFRSRNIVAESTGIIGVIGGLTSLAVVFFVPRWRKPLPVAFVGMILFSLGTAFLTSLGRLGLGIFSSRYQTFNLLFWLSAIGLCLIITDQAVPRLRSTLLVGIPLVMLAAITQFSVVLNAARMLKLQGEAGAVALLTGVPDTAAFQGLDPWTPGAVWEDISYLREQRLFMFSEPWATQMNEPLAKFYDAEPAGACKGQIAVERLSPQDLIAGDAGEDLRVTGWAVTGPTGQPAEQLLIVADGRIVGFGIGGLQLGTGKSKTFLMQRKFIDWSGLARVGPGIRSVDLYAINSRQSRHICLVASAAIP